MASPPLAAVPLGATAAVPAEDFEALWQAYGYFKNRAEAKAVFAKLHDVDLAAIIAAAQRWRIAWEGGGGAKTGRRHLSSWLEREDYRCEPNERRPKAGKPSTVLSPDNDNEPAPAPRMAAVRHDVKIVNAVMDYVDGSHQLIVELATEGGTVFTEIIVLESDDIGAQQAGQREFERLCSAAGVNDIQGVAELTGRRLRYATDCGKTIYEPSASWVYEGDGRPLHDIG